MSNNIDHPTLKAIVKWRNHLNALDISAIHENCERFIFSSVAVTDVTNEIGILNSSKAIQEGDLPVKLFKGNNESFAAFITKYFNDTLKSEKFPNCLKLVSVTPVFNKNAHTSKNNYRPVSVLPPKYLNSLFVTNFQHFLKTFFQTFNVVSVRAIAPNIFCL